jgi:undecaprenyl-diphosphatase
LGPAEAVILGVVQGLTEFLPISSSGHLVLFQQLLGFREPELFFDICLHVGTLGAVCAVFLQEIRSLVSTLVRLPCLARRAGGFKPLYRADANVRMLVLIAWGTLPTAALGFLFREIADRLFASLVVVGFMLLITGTLLWFTRKVKPTGRRLERVTLKDAVLIGTVQGLAILPGISRSGSTISAALYLGVDRDVAGRYSFLLSIPAIIGALVLSLDAVTEPASISLAVLLGTLSAAGVGYLALKLLLKIVRGGQMFRFAPYCWVLGIIALSWSIWRAI